MEASAEEGNIPEEQERESKRRNRSASNASPPLVINIYSWATPIVGVVLLAVGLLAGYFGRPLISPEPSGEAPMSVQTEAPQPTMDPETRQQLMDYLVPQVRHFKGEADAPVTIIEFSDFQCPYCGRFATGAGKQIEAKYIKSGKVRFGYWPMAFLGEESLWAAEASECAADQDKFWEYHDKLFSSQNGENQGAFSKENLKQFAEDIGLDTAAFNECMDSGKYTLILQEQTNTANQLGVRSTPAFIVNGLPVLGAQPFETFEKLIEDELKATK